MTPHFSILGDWVDGGITVEVECLEGRSGQILSCCHILSFLSIFEPQRLRIIGFLGWRGPEAQWLYV